MIIYGKKQARIKHFTTDIHCCASCGAYDTGVNIYREYFHLFFVPLLPVGEKTASARCNACTEPLRTVQVLNLYADKTRTPPYFYTILILFAAMVTLLVFVNIQTQNQKKEYVANPQVGDVYLLRTDDGDFTAYRFIKFTAINGDSLEALHGNHQYLAFRSKFDADDFL